MKTHEYTKLNVNINIKHQLLEQICVTTDKYLTQNKVLT